MWENILGRVMFFLFGSAVAVGSILLSAWDPEMIVFSVLGLVGGCSIAAVGLTGNAESE